VKVLLIQSLTENPEGPIFPMGLASLAAVLREKHEVRVVDMNLGTTPYEDIETANSEYSPDLIGLSIRNIKVAMPGQHISSIVELRAMIKRIIAIAGETPVVVGGAAFSMYANAIMEHIPEIGLGVVGEGEIAFPQLIENYPDARNIPGVIFREDGDVVYQGTAERPDFATLPWPARDLFSMDLYRRYPTSVGVMTKRGCPFNCIHCSDIYLLGNRMRLRDPDDVVAELRDLKDKYGITHFMFSDQEFNVPGNYTKNLLRLLSEADLGLSWTAYFTVHGLDDEMMELFRASGCGMVGFSLDCLGDRVLKTLGKGITMKDVSKANALVRKHQMPVTYNFMLGLPGENLRSLLHIIWFVVRTKLELRALFRLHGLFIVRARIYPHTELRKMAISKGKLDENDDLLTVRFSRFGGRVLEQADRLLEFLVFALWRLKRLVSRKRKGDIPQSF